MSRPPATRGGVFSGSSASKIFQLAFEAVAFLESAGSNETAWKYWACMSCTQITARASPCMCVCTGLARSVCARDANQGQLLVGPRGSALCRTPTIPGASHSRQRVGTSALCRRPFIPDASYLRRCVLSLLFIRPFYFLYFRCSDILGFY